MNGIRYCQIIYPGYISLPSNAAYFYNVVNTIVFVAIDKHIETVKATDFQNKLIINDENIPVLQKPIAEFSEAHFITQYDMGEMPIKRRIVYDYKKETEKIVSTQFYTAIMIGHEIANPSQITDDEEKMLDTILTEFIQAYKFISKDSRTRLPIDIGDEYIIYKQAIIEYSDADKALPIYERISKPRDLKIGVKRFKGIETRASVPQRAAAINRNHEILTQLLLAGFQVPEEWRLLAKAYEELDLNRNYKYALLESFIVAELVISRFLREFKLKRGVSKNKLKEYKSEVGIGYQTNIELPAFLDELTANERKILGEINRIRGIRNDVVHEGKIVSEKEALDSLNATSNLIHLLEKRKKEQKY